MIRTCWPVAFKRVDEPRLPGCLSRETPVGQSQTKLLGTGGHPIWQRCISAAQLEIGAALTNCHGPILFDVPVSGGVVARAGLAECWQYRSRLLYWTWEHVRRDDEQSGVQRVQSIVLQLPSPRTRRRNQDPGPVWVVSRSGEP